MLLALDVGNTNTTLGLYKLDGEKPELAAHWRVTSHRTQTVDEYGVFFVNLFEMHGMSPTQVTDIIIASVVPPVDSTLRQVCETYFHIEPMFVEPGIKTGMKMLIDNPTELGADRLCDCIAAYERYGGPCIVVDFGTATKFEVISAQGEYLGGAIAPGLGLSADALFSRAARLSRVDIKRPAKVIGTNTVGTCKAEFTLVTSASSMASSSAFLPNWEPRRTGRRALSRAAAWHASSRRIRATSRRSMIC
jgi:type III pantothenate kinase